MPSARAFTYCLDETSEILYVGGQTFTAKVKSQQSLFHHVANLDLYMPCTILATICIHRNGSIYTIFIE